MAAVTVPSPPRRTFVAGYIVARFVMPLLQCGLMFLGVQALRDLGAPSLVWIPAGLYAGAFAAYCAGTAARGPRQGWPHPVHPP